jgi:hypothetical protein
VRHFQYPTWVLQATGAAQVIIGVLIMLSPRIGYLLQIAVGAFLALAHAFRQRMPAAASLDVVLMALSAVAAVNLGDQLWMLAVGSGGGVAIYAALAAKYRWRLLKRN